MEPDKPSGKTSAAARRQAALRQRRRLEGRRQRVFWLTDEEARRAKAWIAAGLPDVSTLAQKADETGRLQAIVADMRRINSDLYTARNQCLDDLDEAEETIRRLREELARAQAEIARLQNLLART